METSFLHTIKKLQMQHQTLLAEENKPLEIPGSIATRYKNPVVTAAHIPLEWRTTSTRQPIRIAWSVSGRMLV